MWAGRACPPEMWGHALYHAPSFSPGRCLEVSAVCCWPVAGPGHRQHWESAGPGQETCWHLWGSETESVTVTGICPSIC